MTENDKKKQIIEAGERLFSEKNFGNTQIAEIAKAAGVGIGTFYRYFPDKESLLKEMLTGLLGNIRQRLAETRQDIEHRAPLEQLTSVRRTFQVTFDVMLAKPDLMLTFLRSGYGGTESVSDIVWELLKGIIDDLAVDIGRAEIVGIIAIPDKQVLAHSIIGIVLQLSHKILIEGTPSKEQAINLCTRMTLGMILAFLSHEKMDQYLQIYRMILPPFDSPA